MPDVEKVIKGLECCGYSRYMDKCQECPYDGKDCFKRLKTDALALLKAQEPRVMTYEDMANAEPGTVVFCEQRDEIRTYLAPMIKYDDGLFENRFLAADSLATELYNTRFWTSRPTAEQREATPWN